VRRARENTPPAAKRRTSRAPPDTHEPEGCCARTRKKPSSFNATVASFTSSSNSAPAVVAFARALESSPTPSPATGAMSRYSLETRA